MLSSRSRQSPRPHCAPSSSAGDLDAGTLLIPSEGGVLAEWHPGFSHFDSRFPIRESCWR